MCLVVKAQFFELVTRSPRCYILQKEERCARMTQTAGLNFGTPMCMQVLELCGVPPRCRTLVVNSLIRLKGIKFDKVVKRSPRLGDSQYFFGEDSHNSLDALVRLQEEEKARVQDISPSGGGSSSM